MRDWPIDNYFMAGERKTHFPGCNVTKQHHTCAITKPGGKALKWHSRLIQF